MTKTHAAEFTLVESIPTPPPLGAQALYSAKVATTTLHEGDENTKILHPPPPTLFIHFFDPTVSISHKECAACKSYILTTQ